MMGKGRPKNSRIGETFLTKENYKIEIIEYFGALNCTIKFDTGLILYNKRYDHIREGSITNPNHPNIFGVGYFGIGNYRPKVFFNIYSIWRNMFVRCYDLAYQEKEPTYIECSVDPRWHNFQVFAKWFEQNYVEGYHLDKDILIKYNKIYSPETCCFVPREINNLFTKRQNDRGECPIGIHKLGNKFIARVNKKESRVHVGSFNTKEEAFQAYKTAKETYIKEVANKWKDRITEQIYNTMITYNVEIDD